LTRLRTANKIGANTNDKLFKDKAENRFKIYAGLVSGTHLFVC